MKTFSIVARDDNKSQEISSHLVERLTFHGLTENTDNPDLVISVGGDGTLLKAVHTYLDLIDTCNFISLHTGTLGFFSEYTYEDKEILIDSIVNKEPTIYRRKLLEITKDDNEKLYAVNEARIENIIHTQIIRVFINDEEFETFRGTGLCISTQAGSTAYNRSLGGAVINDDLQLLQLTEITGIHHSLYRSLQVPLILSPNTKIVLKSIDYEQALLCYDAKFTTLHDAKKIELKLSSKEIRFIKYNNNTFISKLRNLF